MMQNRAMAANTIEQTTPLAAVRRATVEALRSLEVDA